MGGSGRAGIEYSDVHVLLAYTVPSWPLLIWITSFSLWCLRFCVFSSWCWHIKICQCCMFCWSTLIVKFSVKKFCKLLAVLNMSLTTCGDIFKIWEFSGETERVHSETLPGVTVLPCFLTRAVKKWFSSLIFCLLVIWYYFFVWYSILLVIFTNCVFTSA